MDISVRAFRECGMRSPIDPRVGIMAILTVSAVMIGGRLDGVHFGLRLFCCLLPFVFLLVIKKRNMAFIYFALYAVAMLLEGAVFQVTSGVCNLIVVMTAGIISRFLAPIVMGFCVMQSTTVSEFITAMERMHVPGCITIPMSVMFRFFPTIAEENNAIMDAMRMRQVAGVKQGIFKRMEYELVPVMMSTVRIADELAQASMTKGLGGKEKRTHICEVGFRVRDYFLLVLLVVVLILFLVY